MELPARTLVGTPGLEYNRSHSVTIHPRLCPPPPAVTQTPEPHRLLHVLVLQQRVPQSGDCSGGGASSTFFPAGETTSSSGLSLFEMHKLMFSFSLCVALLRSRKQVDELEYRCVFSTEHHAASPTLSKVPSTKTASRSPVCAAQRPSHSPVRRERIYYMYIFVVTYLYIVIYI